MDCILFIERTIPVVFFIPFDLKKNVFGSILKPGEQCLG